MDEDTAAQICAKLDALTARVEEMHAKIDAMTAAEAVIARTEQWQEPHPVDARRPRKQSGRVPREPGRHLHVVREG